MSKKIKIKKIKKINNIPVTELPETKQQELSKHYELINSILLADQLRSEVKSTRQEWKLQRHIHKKDGWRAYTI